MKDSILLNKSKQFALGIINACNPVNKDNLFHFLYNRIYNMSDFDILMLAVFVLPTILIIVICILSAIIRHHKQERIKKQIRGLADSTLEMTPEEFMKMRNKSFGGRGSPSYARSHNFAGVYILHNVSKNKYYVGQGIKVLDRVNVHFTGRGNGDVYADYKYGDKFTIKMIALENSGYSSLNELERKTIMTYDAYKSGYNKTRGNGN